MKKLEGVVRANQILPTFVVSGTDSVVSYQQEKWNLIVRETVEPIDSLYSFCTK
jgi:hypothetical protein